MGHLAIVENVEIVSGQLDDCRVPQRYPGVIR